jgi:DNA-binding NarL/FixJ family response regulator
MAVQSIPSVSPRPQGGFEPAGATVAVVAAEPVAARRIAAVAEEASLVAASVSGSVRELLAVTAGRRPDAVVFGGSPSAAESLAAIRLLAKELRGTPIVIVSRLTNGAGARQALSAGASGLVSEPELETTLAPTVRAVLVGHVCVPQAMRRCAVKPTFSHREKQVLAMVVKGYGNRQIASQLFLAESTVKSHLGSAFQKLGVHSRNEAAALLVDPDEGLGVAVFGQ